LDFESVDWPEAVKAMQTNWIGRSEGARVVFDSGAGEIEVFTTRPDTLWGATFMVLAPEHPLVGALTVDGHRDEVEAYRIAAARRSELERLEETADKTGVFTGSYAVNPVNNAKIPIWVADYVLISYGTGAIMAVPAHDERDFAFARKFGIEVIPVIHPQGMDPLDGDSMVGPYVGPGVMVSSGPIDGIEVTDAKGRANPSVSAAIDWLVDHGRGEEAINYRLRDWLISRQRYWGAPIPMVHCEDGTIEAVPDKELPVVLPEDVKFDGTSPLAKTPEFVETVDSKGRSARRETDTMDTFMCSSWYWLRYLSPQFDSGPFDPEEAAYWLPVDTYTGGAEHAVMHLMYARFFQKALRDMGIFEEAAQVMKAHGRDPEGAFGEPFVMLRNQGQILGEERQGDWVVIEGDKDGEVIRASSLKVEPGASPGLGKIVGELLRRTENLLQIGTADGTVTVEVPDSAPVEIPGIPGPNDVSQLKHHLEIQRMSKSKGNVVNPDLLVKEFGADTVRTYLMFSFEWLKGGPWDSRGISGSRRFIEDVWKIGTHEYRAGEVSDSASVGLRRSIHQAILKVGSDLQAFKWNTAVAALMSLRNDMLAVRKDANVDESVWNEGVDTLLLLLAPIAPHITDALWNRRGHVGSIHLESWPEADLEAVKADTVTMIVQINGKVRDRIEVDANIGQKDAEALALESEKIKNWIEGSEIRKVIVRPPALVNIVIG